MHQFNTLKYKDVPFNFGGACPQTTPPQRVQMGSTHHSKNRFARFVLDVCFSRINLKSENTFTTNLSFTLI